MISIPCMQTLNLSSYYTYAMHIHTAVCILYPAMPLKKATEKVPNHFAEAGEQRILIMDMPEMEYKLLDKLKL